MPPVTLGKGVNPHGVLEAIIKQGAHVHGEENRVQHHAAAGPGGLNQESDALQDDSPISQVQRRGAEGLAYR